jgi:hypothetical protein
MKVFHRTAVCLAVLTLSLSALAASKENIVVAKDGIRIMTTSPTKAATPYIDNISSSAVTLYSNLAFGYPKAIYWCCYGGLLAGPNSSYGQKNGPVWQAAGFTPTSNLTVTKVKLGIAWQSGNTNDVIVSITADNNGVPGTVLSKWKVTKLPTFGTCCTVMSHKVPKGGVAVTAGTPYWVVISTEANSDFQGAWDFDIKDEIDTIPDAYNYKGVWYPFPANINFSFGVYGQ